MTCCFCMKRNFKEKEGKNMEGKKFATVSGVLLFPLCVGCRAIILHGTSYTHTSKVVAIHSVQPGNIRFETENTHYRLLLNPMSQAVDCRPALGMAA